MIAYLLRRLLLAVPTLIGVNLLLFTLFFVISSPDDMARAQLGAKRVTTEAIERELAAQQHAGRGGDHRHEGVEDARARRGQPRRGLGGRDDRR